MNKHSFKIRTVLVGLLATFVTVSISVPAMANNKTKVVAVQQTTTQAPAVTYLGSENNTSLFSIAFNNDSTVKFDVIIRDADGDAIYNETYEASAFAKTFKLVNNGINAGPAGLTFTIQVKPSGEQYSFEVSSETEAVKQVEIVKL